MTNRKESTLHRLLSACLPADDCQVPLRTVEDCPALLRTVKVAPSVLDEAEGEVSRAVVAQALNLLLFRDLLARVPTGQRYVAECVSEGRQVVFDHGALRTVALGGMGDLPAGEEAITRVLLPLGYKMTAVYPLDRLGMTGRSYTHSDFPEELPQFFVSELHPERFSPGFQNAVARVTASSRDPLSESARSALRELSDRSLSPFDRAAALLPILLACFQRQHADPAWSDYEILLAESAEMAWIATEGNVFNHATDRVPSLDALVAGQRLLSRPLKDTIETSRSGRVRQTAFRADPVERSFTDANGALVRRSVPGSFYEFIQRDRLRDLVTGISCLDLAFDSGNAQGIFKMTAAA
jgi:2-oxoadipate dioxygenase/decarboxylase